MKEMQSEANAARKTLFLNLTFQLIFVELVLVVVVVALVLVLVLLMMYLQIIGRLCRQHWLRNAYPHEGWVLREWEALRG